MSAHRHGIILASNTYDPPHTDPSLQAFIARWHASGAAEQANYQLFLSELCAVLDLPAPDPASPVEAENTYVFEKAVPLPYSATGRSHVTWALAAGNHLGVGNDPVYAKTACFEKFPFPAATDAQQCASATSPNNWTLTASASRPNIPNWP